MRSPLVGIGDRLADQAIQIVVGVARRGGPSCSSDRYAIADRVERVRIAGDHACRAVVFSRKTSRFRSSYSRVSSVALGYCVCTRLLTAS